MKRKKDIEETIGVKKFIDECKTYVSEVSGEWEWYVDHIGRWVDFKNAYKTMDTTYMESVWWALKTFWDKGLVYEGRKVLLYCPRCETPISKFEVAMDNSYEEVTEIAVTVKFRLHPRQKIGDWMTDEASYMLAWTTTPWTIPFNLGIMVNPSLDYIKAKVEDEVWIVAKALAGVLISGLVNKKFSVIEELKGDKLLGLKYTHPFEYDFPK